MTLNWHTAIAFYLDYRTTDERQSGHIVIAADAIVSLINCEYTGVYPPVPNRDEAHFERINPDKPRIGKSREEYIRSFEGQPGLVRVSPRQLTDVERRQLEAIYNAFKL